MRRTLLVSSTALMLVLAGSSTAAAQDDPPSPGESSPPSEAESIPEPPPVADYWVEWVDHKQASHERASRSIQDAKRSRSKTARWYQTLLRVHEDELEWLANHQPMGCYQAEYQRWSDAVEDLQSIHREALRSVRGKDDAGVRRTDKQRRAAMKRLNGELASIAPCGPTGSITTDALTSGGELAGRWKTTQRFVNGDGVNVTHQASTKIDGDGRFLLKVKRDDFCRQRGFGFRPLTLSGQGEILVEDGLGLTWDRAKLHCYPRRGGRKLVLESGPPASPWRYDETYDVLLGVQGPGSCSWRARTGSPDDCQRFWRGTPIPVEDTDAAVEDGGATLEEATTPVDEGA